VARFNRDGPAELAGMTSGVQGSLRTLMEPDHDAFRDLARSWVDGVVVPRMAGWDNDHLIDRETWRHAGSLGLIGLPAPVELGGGGQGGDFRFRVVLIEEIARVGAAALNSSFSLQDDIVLPYLLDLGTPEQHQRWVPASTAGSLIGAIAMTEPGAGSDLRGIRTTAVRDGDDWVLSGSKTFVTSGIQSDYVIVVARTNEVQVTHAEYSLIVVEAGTPGFERGRKLDKIGLAAQDTGELYFADARVPIANTLGEAGRGLHYLMERLPRERLSIAVMAQAAARAALEWTLDYTKQRHAFGNPLTSQQTVQFAFAEMSTEVEVTQSYLDAAVLALNTGTLNAVDAARAKWWATEMQKRVIDRCLQLFGGYGYMREYPIARAYLDARVQTIYGGTTEIMKHIIGRDLTADKSRRLADDHDSITAEDDHIRRGAG
jgi:acyl-CoA dehydrogenase